MQVKDRVLEALEANRGTYFSGEALAQKLAVSRSAVWKAIQQLRESGYPIEAASKRGYCLAKDSAILSAQSIAQYLTVPQLRLEVEQLVTSTNTLLRQRAEAGSRRAWPWSPPRRRPGGADGTTRFSLPRIRDST